jgi:hypothetical protein
VNETALFMHYPFFPRTKTMPCRKSHCFAARAKAREQRMLDRFVAWSANESFD